MSLIDRITDLFRRSQPEDQPTTAAEMPQGRRPTAAARRFSTDRSRQEKVRRCREMYADDPRGKEVVKALARDMVKSGFTVATRDARAEEITKDLVRRLDLFSRIDDWVRLALRDGDSFLEVSIDENLEIVDVTRKPTLEMHRNSNDRDQFEDPERAFWWADSIYGALGPPEDAVWFAEWQIIHARWDHDEGSRYGTPLFASATSAYKRMVQGEKDIATRRWTRAGLKYVHRFPDGTDGTYIDEYREKNRDALSQANPAIADFFGTVDINVVQGDARLQEIGDVVHHIRTWWISSPVPMSLLGYGQDLNRDVLEDQKEQYDEALLGLQQWVTDQIVKPLLELQWLLAGIWPAALEYEIEWKSKQLLTAADIRDLADAALKLRALGLPPDVVWQLLAKFFPGVDLVDLLAQVGATDPTAGNASPGRMANTADRFLPHGEEA
ncbi:MAG: hypothetical protein ACLFU8_06125 [Anaerolineales bacterium]